MDEILKKQVDERIRKLVPDLAQTQAFSNRKLTDTPADAYQIVSRKYVTLNGTSSSRPTSSIIGQFYYDTTINKPIWWSEDGCFKDAAGNVV